MSTTAYRCIVIWLLLLIAWGVFRGLAASDDFVVVHAIRDIAGASLWLFPLGAGFVWAVERFDVQPNRR